MGEGRPAPKLRGRVYYDRLRGYHSGEDLERVYKVGDVVVMNGEHNERWFAQIVEFFQVHENDSELREILHMDSRRIAGTEHYELMRCTLRWFYNVGDVDKQSFRRSRIPKPESNEIYFSDHVEKDGYNDVTIIEGLAFLVGSSVARKDFLREPPQRYSEDFDHVCIVRCFINSNIDEPVLRSLDKGELHYLLQNPTSEKDLYEKSRQRMLGKGRSKDPVMKSLSKKKKRIGRPVISFDDEDYDVEERTRRRSKSEAMPKDDRSDEDWQPLEPKAQKEHKGKERRRKHVVSDEEEGADGDHDMEDAANVDLSTQQAQTLNAANDEVFDLVAELNANVDQSNSFVKEEQATAIDVDHLDPRTEAPFSGKRRKVQSKRRPHADLVPTIVLDVDDSVEEVNQLPQRAKGMSREEKEKRAALAKARRQDKPRPSFMPTMRKSTREGKGTARLLGSEKSALEEPISRPSASEANSTEKRDKPVKETAAKSNAVKNITAKNSVAKKSIEKNTASKNTASKHGASKHGAAKDRAQKESAIEPSKKVPAKDPASLSIRKDGGRTVSMDPTSQGMLRMDMDGPDRPSTQKASAGNAMLKTRVESGVDAGQEEEGESEWWSELTKVLAQIKAELGKIPKESQELFKAHIDFIFDMAVAKVAEGGFTEDVDENDERIQGLIEEMMDELRKKLDESKRARHPELDGVRRGAGDMMAKAMEV